MAENITYPQNENMYYDLQNNTENVTDTIKPGAAAIVVPIIFSFLFVIGIIGNGTLIYTVVANKCMRNVPNILIVSLSIGDVVLLVMTAPFSALTFAMEAYPFGEVVCKGNEYLQSLSVGVSVFTLTALSGDRFFAIVYPMSKHKGNSKLKIGVTVAVIWILSAFLAIPDAFFNHIFYYNGNNYCTPRHLEFENAIKIHLILKFLVFFVIPLFVIAAFYCRMAKILIKSGREIPCDTGLQHLSRQQQRQVKARVKVAKVVLSFVFLFVLCWLPRYVYLMWYWWSPDDANDESEYYFFAILKSVSYCLIYLYSCVNPYALYFLSGQFRKYYNRYIFRCCPKSYRPIQPESAVIFNGTTRRGSTSLTIIKAQSDL